MEFCFAHAGYKNIEWQGQGLQEKLVDLADNNRVLVEVDEQFFRPGEVPYLRGGNEKIRRSLGWEPTYTWRELMREMVEFDLSLQER